MCVICLIGAVTTSSFLVTCDSSLSGHCIAVTVLNLKRHLSSKEHSVLFSFVSLAQVPDKIWGGSAW